MRSKQIQRLKFPLYQDLETHLANFLVPSALGEAGQSHVQDLHLEENFYFC